MFQIYLKVILSNWAFWLSFLLVLGYIFFEFFHDKVVSRKVWNHGWYSGTFKRFTWKKALAVFGAFLLVVPLSVYLCFETNSDTADYCHNGSYVVSAHYQEGYTKEWDTIETETSTDSKGNTQTRTYVKHHVEHVPPSWWAKTSENRTIDISSSDYANYTHYFGSNTFEHCINSDQTSVGDGNRYHSTWNPKYPMMPVSYDYAYANYIKASKRTILRQRGLDTKPFANLLTSYPQVHSEGYGPIALDRVIVRGVNVPTEWIHQVNYALGVFTAKNGATYQINPQVYIAGTDNPAFANVLRQEWIGGKKNDAILVVGMRQWPKIDWVDTIHWSKKSEFGIQWRDFVQEKDFSDPNTVLDGLGSAVKYYQRRSFKEYRYLLADVEIPAWANLIVLVINIGLAILMVKVLENLE